MIQISPAERAWTDGKVFQMEGPVYVKAWRIMVSQINFKMCFARNLESTDLHPKLTPCLVQRTPQISDKHPGVFAQNKDANHKVHFGSAWYQM